MHYPSRTHHHQDDFKLHNPGPDLTFIWTAPGERTGVLGRRVLQTHTPLAGQALLIKWSSSSSSGGSRPESGIPFAHKADDFRLTEGGNRAGGGESYVIKFNDLFLPARTSFDFPMA